MKLEKNSQGIYRVILDNGRYLMDEDVMGLIPSNHRSSIQLYFSRKDAVFGYAKYMERFKTINIPEGSLIKDDWKEEE